MCVLIISGTPVNLQKGCTKFITPFNNVQLCEGSFPHTITNTMIIILLHLCQIV